MKALHQLFTGGDREFPQELSTDDRRRGRSLFYRFYALNGISVACLMNHVLVLYAIRNGLSDAVVAVMASFIHLAMPFMMLGKPAIARFGAARTRGLGWFFRYVSALIMVVVPFAGGLFPQYVVTALLLLGAFGFAAFRSIGVAAINPLQGEVTEPHERGRFISSAHMRVQITYFITMALIILSFRFLDEIWLYQLILATGCLIGFYTSTIMALIPESSAPTNSARRSYKEMLYRTVKNPSYRQVIYTRCAGMSAKAIIIPFLIITVKNGYGVSDYSALFFGLILVFGAAMAGFINRKFSDLIGPRMMMLLYIGGMMLVAAFMCFAPRQFIPAFPGMVFLLAGFCDIGLTIGMNQYFLGVVPEHDRVGNSMMMHIIAGAAAGLSGSVLGGGLLALFAYVGFDGLSLYRSYFTVILVVLFGFFMVVRRIEDSRRFQT